MRTISPPIYDPQEVFRDCAAGISDIYLRAKFESIETRHLAQVVEYASKARNADLYTLPIFAGKKADIVTAGITKGEFAAFYSQYFAGKGKPARGYYDALLTSAPNQKCPYCGFGHVYTLDHYLPKSKYPELSVVLSNLVPSCRDCNEGTKRSSIASSAAEQPLHPYFDRGDFYRTQWLSARVIETVPASIEFYVSCPRSWDPVNEARVRSHFKDFRLKTRYAVEAGEELSSLSPRLRMYHFDETAEEIRAYLDETLEVEQAKHQNSWMTAMYRALIQSDWYCGGGFAL